MVADSEELENLDASQIHARRLNAKEVLMPNNGNHFICPIADGPVKIVLARSGFPTIHLKIRITQHVERSTTMFFEAESDGSHPSDTLTDDGEARNDFLDDRWELYLSSSVPKGESFPNPLRFF